MHTSNNFVRAQQSVVNICVAHEQTQVLGESILKSDNPKKL